MTASDDTTTSHEAPVHLVIIAHGLWGTPEHVAHLASTLEETSKRKRSEAKLADPAKSALPGIHVLRPTSNSWTHTYDGIDYCSLRILIELEAELEKLKQDGKSVTHLSAVGYSLGGLTLRYLIGLLSVRKKQWWDSVEKVQFTTFASPWVGIPVADSALGGLVRFVGSKMLSRTGRQLYLADRYGPLPGLGGDGKDPVATDSAPLLAHLADPKSLFMTALLSFRRIVVFVNFTQDPTVPFVTGCFEKHDHCREARSWVKRERKVKGWRADEGWRSSKTDEEYERQWEAAVGESVWGGTRVEIEPDYDPVIKSVALTPRTPMPKPPKSLRRTFVNGMIAKIPTILRPSALFFAAPYNYIVFALSPLLFPAFLCYLLGSFAWASRKSAKRIKQLQDLLDKLAKEGRTIDTEPHLVALLTAQEHHEGGLEEAMEHATADMTRMTAESVGVSDPSVDDPAAHQNQPNGDASGDKPLQQRRSSISAAPTRPPALHRVLSKGTGDVTPPLVDPFGEPSGSLPPRQLPDLVSAATERPAMVPEEPADEREASPSVMIYNEGKFRRGPWKSQQEAPDYLCDARQQEDALHRTGLTELQLTMIDWLNGLEHQGSDGRKLPGLGAKVEKRLAFFSRLRNSHGAIVFRRTGISDPRGKAVVQCWADNFSYA